MSNLVDNLEIQPEYEFIVRTRKTKPAKKPNTFGFEFRVFDISRSCIATPEGHNEDIYHFFPEKRLLKNAGKFPIQSRYLLSDDLAREKIPIFLSAILKIPEAKHAEIIDMMCSVARSITSKSVSIFLAVASIKVKIYEYHEYLDMLRAQIEAMEAQEAKPIPATKASIDALERVIIEVDGEESMQQCMICMEEFEGGTEITCMPCSHIYHGDCIVQWLETSHLCPLCRFPMPHLQG